MVRQADMPKVIALRTTRFSQPKKVPDQILAVCSPVLFRLQEHLLTPTLKSLQRVVELVPGNQRVQFVHAVVVGEAERTW